MSLQHAVLGILTYSPMNGYSLNKIFDKSINYSWTASLSQIYRELGNLEKKGCVTSCIIQQEDKPDKKIYSITPEGEKMFNEWLGAFPESFSSPKRDEFMLRMFFGSKIGSDKLIVQLKRYIEERENFKKLMSDGKEKIIGLGKIMKKVTDESSMDNDKLYWRLIVNRALMTNQALIDWARECIEELEQHNKHN